MMPRARCRRSVLWLVLATVGLAACGTTKAARRRSVQKVLARELITRGDGPGAFAVVRKLHAEDPEDTDVLVLRGTLYREQGLLEEAEADLRQALELDGDRADAHAALAVLLDRRRSHEGALSHHERAAELEPTRPDYLNNLGFAFYARGRTNKAVKTLRQALRLAPGERRIRNNLGFALARSGDFPGAARAFDAGGSPAESRNNLGFAYERAGNLAAAYDLYQEAVALAPKMTQARKNLAGVAQKIGRPGPEPLTTEPSTGEADEE